MRKAFVTAMLCAPLLAGCATLGIGPRPLGAELAGQTLRTETQRGQVSALHFARDGTVQAQFGGRTLAGRWQVRDRNLCFFWPNAPRECWPYARPFERGRPQVVTSDRGNVVRVTLQ